MKISTPTVALLLLILIHSKNAFAKAIEIASISSVVGIEGDVLEHEIILTGTTTETISFGYTFVTNTTVFGGSFSDISSVRLPDGQNFDTKNQLIYIPSGHSKFRFQTFTVLDTSEEEDEFYTLTIGGISATGTILDSGSNNTTVTAIDDVTIIEGDTIIHQVTLSNLLVKNKKFVFALVDDNATYGLDYAELTFSDDITYDEISGVITVPKNDMGLVGFTIIMGSNDDQAVEGDEYYTLNVDNVSATGTILDNDQLAIVAIRDASENEGSDLWHEVVLNALSPIEKTFAFFIVDISTDGEDYRLPEFSNGVTYDPMNKHILVPSGIRSFGITIPTVDDPWAENDESYTISVDGLSAIGKLLDNDSYNVPTFFTPNSDNINDTWPTDLTEKNEMYTNADIYVFNRYGSLIKQIDPSSSGWDGTINGQLMPRGDYWYRIKLENGTLLSGHFTLKR